MSSKNPNKINRVKKIFILLIFIALALLILFSSIFITVAKKRNLPRLQSSKKELAIRGNIISADNFKIASSKKLYKASIDTRYLDLNKKELFIRLFSIYSNIPSKKIRQKINQSLKKPGYVVLSYNVDSRNAKNLKELSFKLRRLKVFKALKRNGGSILRGLSIDESGEKRLYSYSNTLTPIIGYVQKTEDQVNKTTKVRGVKGLERSYNNLLNNTKDGMLKGKRDVLSYISFDKNSVIKGREDGATLVLNIPLKLQKNIELILDKHKKKLGADEIMVSIMDSQTGKILSLATSNRFDPENIKSSQLEFLNPKVIEYAFEPGSILKPISIALVMDKGKLKRRELFKAHNDGKPNSKGEYPRGKYKIGRFYIKDDHRFKKRFLTLDDIFIYSSNIGTLQMAQRLKAKEFVEGLHKFGITKKTGIDLTNEKVGRLPSLRQFRAGEQQKKDNIYKATVSYGQGMTGNFMQMMKAYSVFNNEGIITTPKIVSYLNLHDMEKIQLQKKIEKRIIKKRTANEIKRLLIKTVTQGTGKAAIIKGIEVGGKTGTANIAGGGKYLKKYISSFFGFANDQDNRYTIGVTVINPISTGKYWYYYYASQSAVPVFKDMVNSMIQLGFLTSKVDTRQ